MKIKVKPAVEKVKGGKERLFGLSEKGERKLLKRSLAGYKKAEALRISQKLAES